MPYYMLYTDHRDPYFAKVYVEVGEVHVVPSKGDRVMLHDPAQTTYVVTRVEWDVFTKRVNGEGGQYPQQHVTVFIKAYVPRRRKK